MIVVANLLPAFLMGLLGGAHCVAMCGGASAALCGRERVAGAGPASRGIGVGYNLGRVLGYATLGGIVGTIGALPLGGAVDTIRFTLRAMAAVCMLAVGLNLFGLPSFVGRLEAIGGPVWRGVAPIARRLVPLRSFPAAIATGALWALMPCGLLYGALAIAATSESPLAGAATMAAFALGTLPVMLTMTTLAARVAAALRRPIVRRAAGALVLAFGLWNSAGIARQVLSPTHSCCPR